MSIDSPCSHMLNKENFDRDKFSMTRVFRRLYSICIMSGVTPCPFFNRQQAYHHEKIRIYYFLRSKYFRKYICNIFYFKCLNMNVPLKERKLQIFSFIFPSVLIADKQLAVTGCLPRNFQIATQQPMLLVTTIKIKYYALSQVKIRFSTFCQKPPLSIQGKNDPQIVPLYVQIQRIINISII